MIRIIIIKNYISKIILHKRHYLRLPFLAMLAMVFLYYSTLIAEAAGSGSLEFVPRQVNLKTNDQKTVKLAFNPDGEKVIGVDVILRYDPQYISVIDIRDLKAFSGQTGEVIDNNSGKVKYALSNSYGVYTSHRANIAEIVIEAKRATNQTNINFEFTYGKTNDSNIVISHGKDILTDVDPLKIQISEDKSNSDCPSGSCNNNQISSDTDSGTDIGQVSGASDESGMQNIETKYPGIISPLAEVKAESTQAGLITDSTNSTDQSNKPPGLNQIPQTINQVGEQIRDQKMWWLLAILFGLIVIYSILRYLKKKILDRPADYATTAPLD